MMPTILHFSLGPITWLLYHRKCNRQSLSP